MVNIEITGANRLAAVTEEGALFGKPLESAKAAAHEIVDARVQTVEAALPGRVEAVVTEKLPAAVQAAAGSEITRQIDERVTPTIESKVSSVIADKTAGIKTEILSSVTTEIDSKVEAGKTAAVTEAKSAIPAIVDSAVHESISKIDIGEKDFGFTGRDIAATSYWHPDFWNENTQKGSEWRKLLNTGSSLGIVVLDKASGEWGDAVDENFLKQGMLAEAAGAKWCAFYLSSRFGAMAEEADAAYREEVRKNLNVTMDKVERATFDRIVQQAKNIISWYKGPDKIRKVAIFVDEAVHGWSEGQKKVVPWYKRLYLRLKKELGEDVLIIINPGANTVPEMMEACDVAITYESSASKYIDPETKFIHPDHYKTMPAWRFWHVIHGVTKDNIDAVFATAEKFNIGHLYATDQKFSVGTGSEDEPEENPYDYAPSDWVIQDTKSWVKGVLPFEQRVSALETVRTVPAGGTYNLSEGQSIGGFFLAGAVTHPAGVQWQTPNSAAPSTGLVILIRANDTIYGYAPGMTSAPAVAAAQTPAASVPSTGWRLMTEHWKIPGGYIYMRRDGNQVTILAANHFTGGSTIPKGKYLQLAFPSGFRPDVPKGPYTAGTRVRATFAQTVLTGNSGEIIGGRNRMWIVWDTDETARNRKTDVSFNIQVDAEAILEGGQITYITAEPFPQELPGSPIQ